METSYFPKFRFAPFPEVPEEPAPLITYEGIIDVSGSCYISLGEGTPEPILFPASDNVRTIRDVYPEFECGLSAVGHEIGRTFTMRNRRLMLVPPHELKPKTEEDRQWLIRRYGHYMLEGGAGDCCEMDDGSFRLRVAVSKRRGSSRNDVLRIAAHEYGHTLGSFSSAVDDELQANAFASLFQRANDGVSSYASLDGIFYPDRPHDASEYYLAQLLRAGISEGMIISHLLQKPFGRFRPNDYRAYC